MPQTLVNGKRLPIL